MVWILIGWLIYVGSLFIWLVWILISWLIYGLDTYLFVDLWSELLVDWWINGLDTNLLVDLWDEYQLVYLYLY